MQANTGDRIVDQGPSCRRAGPPVRGPRGAGRDGGSPYYVRWDDGSEGLIYPGSDAMVAAGDPPQAPTPTSPTGDRLVSGGADRMR